MDLAVEANALGRYTIFPQHESATVPKDRMVRAGVCGVSLDSRDAGVDLAAAAREVPPDVVVIGNINPAATMLSGTPQLIRREAEGLLAEMAPFPNFVLSMGCDLPQETPPQSIRAFMDAGREWRRD